MSLALSNHLLYWLNIGCLYSSTLFDQRYCNESGNIDWNRKNEKNFNYLLNKSSVTIIIQHSDEMIPLDLFLSSFWKKKSTRFQNENHLLNVSHYAHLLSLIENQSKHNKISWRYDSDAKID